MINVHRVSNFQRRLNSAKKKIEIFLIIIKIFSNYFFLRSNVIILNFQ